jgi:hypothetical protein
MSKANKPGSQRANAPNNSADAQKAAAQPAQPGASTPQPAMHRSKQGSKNRKPTIGGTAVQGAKSTQPKEIPTTPAAQQQPESYNREMRRRMQHMGTGPYSEPAPNPARKRMQKRLDERKKRQEAAKKTVVTKGPSTDIKVGRRNTYFLLGAVAIVLLIIVIAIIIRHPF